MTPGAAGILAVLEAERERLAEERRRLEASISSCSVSEETGEIADLRHHPADSATAAFDREQMGVMLQNVESLLRKVDRALEKLRDGTYGLCDRCGREIAAPRLEALPSACLCLQCQDLEDQL